MPLVTLTDITLRHLKPPEAGYVLYTDKSLKGFGVRVTANGAKSFILTYGPARKRVTLGDVGIVKLSSARDRAKTILAEHQLGGEKPRSKTFDAALRLFIELHCRPNNKPSTAKETERLLTRHFEPLSAKSLDTIGTGDLMEIVDRLKPSEANHAFTAAKTFFNWCLGRGYIERHPLQALKKPTRAISRARVLTPEELGKVLSTAKSAGNYGILLQLLIYTGQRVGQFAPKFTGSLDGETLRWPAEAMKGNAEHVIPLTPKVRELLDQLKPFNNFSTAHRRFLTACGVQHFTRHDLRRVFSTYNAGMLRSPPHHVEAIIAHKGVISGVSAIYNRWEYLDDQRTCLQKWENYLSSLRS